MALMALDTARRSLSRGAPQAALSEAKQAAEQAAGDLELLAEAVSVQSLALLACASAVEARQLVEQQLRAARAAGHKTAELQLLSALSSCTLALDVATARNAAAEGLELVKKVDKQKHRKLQLQLLIAKGNAEVTDQRLPEAAQAACEALSISRLQQDEEGQGEALHLICLLHLFFGRTAAQKALASAGTPVMASLDSSNEVAVLMRRLGNQEGEGVALLSIGEARLKEKNHLEAQGAAERALEIFRALKHRRGRLLALQLLTRSVSDTLLALEATESELLLFEGEEDVCGQLAALRGLAEAYAARRLLGEARAALRRAAALAALAPDSAEEAQSLLLLSHLEDLAGRGAEAIAHAERALTLSRGSDAAHARRWLSQLYVKGGRSQDAPNRQKALESLRALTEAVRKRDAEAFRATMEALEELSGYSEADVKAALILEDDPDQAGLTRFLKQQGQSRESCSSGSMVMTALSHALLYLSFRVGGLGYGPRFRRCNAYGVRGDGDETTCVAYLRHLSSQEEWTKNMEIQPAMLDSMQHSLNAVSMT